MAGRRSAVSPGKRQPALGLYLLLAVNRTVEPRSAASVGSRLDAILESQFQIALSVSIVTIYRR